MGLREWLESRKQRKALKEFFENEFLRLSIQEQKQNIKLQKLQFKLLRLEEEKLRRKPEYVS